MSEQPLDLRRGARAIRRHSVVFLALVGLGIGGGVVFAATQPPVYIARSRVLLPPSAVDAKGARLRDIKTELNVARSQEILTPAGEKLEPPAQASELRRRITLKSVTDDILQIAASARTPSQAVRVADAVAAEYVAFSNGVVNDEASTTVGVLQDQADKLSGQIQQLDADIAANANRLAAVDQRSAEGVRLRALIDSLRTQQADSARHLQGLLTQITDARLSAELYRRGTRILEPATLPVAPAHPRPVLDSVAGGLAGVILGTLLALAFDRGDHRLRTKDAISQAAGSPVLACLSAPKRPSAGHCRTLLESWMPDALEQLALRHALAALVIERPDGSGACILVATLPNDRAAPLAAAKLAVGAAMLGIRSGFVVRTSNRTAAPLRAVCNSFADTQPTVRANLTIFPTSAALTTACRGGAIELGFIVDVVEADEAVVPPDGLRTLSAMVLSSGFATTEPVAAAAVALIDVTPMEGVVVVNADPNDGTTGWHRRGLGPRTWTSSVADPPLASGAPGEIGPGDVSEPHVDPDATGEPLTVSPLVTNGADGAETAKPSKQAESRSRMNAVPPVEMSSDPPLASAAPGDLGAGDVSEPLEDPGAAPDLPKVSVSRRVTDRSDGAETAKPSKRAGSRSPRKPVPAGEMSAKLPVASRAPRKARAGDASVPLGDQRAAPGQRKVSALVTNGPDGAETAQPSKRAGSRSRRKAVPPGETS